MRKEGPSENDEVMPPTATLMEGDFVYHHREDQEELPSGMHSLNNNEENHNLHHTEVGEGSNDQIILNNDEENHNLQHATLEVLVDQTNETLEKKPEEVLFSEFKEENHNIHHERVEASDYQTTETLEQKPEEVQSLNVVEENHNFHNEKIESLDDQTIETVELKPEEVQPLNINEEEHNLHHEVREGPDDQTIYTRGLRPGNLEEPNQSMEENMEEKVVDPVFDGTEIPEVEVTRNSSTRLVDLDPEAQGSGWPEKAVSLKNFVKEKSTVAVSTVLRRLSGKKDEYDQSIPECQEKNDNSTSSIQDEEDLSLDGKSKEASQKMADKSSWNPLNYVRITRDVDLDNTVDQGEVFCTESFLPTPVLKGRIILYTRLGCHECREVRFFLHQRKLRYVEINLDVYPSRKSELERYTGSPAVPMVLFNEVPIGGLSKLTDMDKSGELQDKINDIISKEPSPKAPLPPLSGEDDESCNGAVDELATIVKKMRDAILVRDRFYRMRRYSNCFLGSEAVDFLMQDQDLQREQAVEFGRKLVSKYFFRHVLQENVFEDGNYLYRFLDHDPIVMSQCYNIPRGIIDAKPKSLTDISLRLRFLCLAIFEAYASEDGKHVDYRSIHGSEEFARYLRIVEELQRVEMHDFSREEKLAFFINLYNMMAIHAILIWGYPAGALERRKMLGDFKYVIGGNTYSLSAIQNGILRGNQRPPYNLIKPFGVKDQRSKIALPYPEPLIHFALVNGTRSGPPLRCFSPGNIDKELMEAARDFLRNGGVVFNPEAKVASVSKILRWYSLDFGKNDLEVLKHAANYLEPEKSEELLELVANTQLKVIYQSYDWGLNY